MVRLGGNRFDHRKEGNGASSISRTPWHSGRGQWQNQVVWLLLALRVGDVCRILDVPLWPERSEKRVGPGKGTGA